VASGFPENGKNDKDLKRPISSIGTADGKLLQPK
jgi:hypothetical protein